MNKASQRNLILTIVFTLLIGGAMSFGLWFFENNKPEIITVIILSVLICVSLFFLIIRHYEKLSEHPVFSKILLSSYLIMGIMLCFPNSSMSSFGLYFIVMIPVAGFSGLSFALVMLLGSFGIITVLDGEITLEIIVWALFSLISCFQIFDDKKGRDLIKRFAVATMVEAIITLLVYGIKSDKNLLIHSIIVMFLYLAVLTVIGLIRSNNLAFWSVFDYGYEDETPVTAKPGLGNKPALNSELSFDELCKPDNFYAGLLKERLPKCFEKAVTLSSLCDKAAGASGADTKLVFAMTFFKDIIRLKAEDESVENYVNKLLIPEKLKKAIINENKPDWHPADFEEIIAYVGNGIVSTSNYVKKNNLNVSGEKIVDNICTLLLKKGYARDCMISMSSFHRMKQGFTENIGIIEK